MFARRAVSAAPTKVTGSIPLPPEWRSRARSLAALVSLTLLSLAWLTLLLHVVGGWYLASVLDERALSAEARRDSLRPTYKIRVSGVTESAITLAKTGDQRLERPGTYGLDWPGGWGTVGAILADREGQVTRAFTRISGPPPAEDSLAALDSRVYQGDPLSSRGLEFEDVVYRGELGGYPAWLVPGTGSAWLVFVHGNGMSRADALRFLPTLAGTGMPILVPTYRGDEGAPEDPDGRLTYGKNEWRDLEAAVRYALEHGASSVVLQGVSMGGGIATAFLLESPLANRVTGVILDSPVLDFEASVEWQARDEHLPLIGVPVPRSLVNVAEWWAGVRFNVDWGSTKYVGRARQLDVPMLLIHGDADDNTPVTTTDDLARQRPDLVYDYYRPQGAGHVEAWNLDPSAYEERVLAFLSWLEAAR